MVAQVVAVAPLMEHLQVVLETLRLNHLPKVVMVVAVYQMLVVEAAVLVR
jgi:hypothetical protein